MIRASFQKEDFAKHTSYLQKINVMIKTLKLKIIASFIFFIATLAIAGLISIIEFRWFNNSIHSLIEDNYKSIDAAKTMIQELEREDSGILLLMLGEKQKGLQIIHSADSLFKVAFNIAKNNLTEKNEEKFIENIKNAYLAYKTSWEKALLSSLKMSNIKWYTDDIHIKFSDSKKAVNKLMTLNQTSMYKEASDLKEKSKSVIMPGMASILAALMMSLILIFLITRYFVNPISELVNTVNNYKEGDKLLKSNVTTNNEIKKLEQAISDLLQRLVTNYNTMK